MGRRQRALTADRDEDVDTVVIQSFLNAVEAFAQHSWVDPRGTKHGSTTGKDLIYTIVEPQTLFAVFEQASPPVAEPNDSAAVPNLAGPHNRTDHRIQSRTVTTTGEYSNALQAHLRFSTSSTFVTSLG
ncbi:hypothetical protein GCM10011410_00350 [Hoyosella rhizosphaerae]|uniref:Uncharacterized protein n=1 Tax=Hoyosella rhizosphaerae TaxID=1755582 RepID=A0A916X8I5_9ACTN|nr:hypothetical protein GCM10011410_00350 [Hoyosella rhizosphaerae]